MVYFYYWVDRVFYILFLAQRACNIPPGYPFKLYTRKRATNWLVFCSGQICLRKVFLKAGRCARPFVHSVASLLTSNGPLYPLEARNNWSFSAFVRATWTKPQTTGASRWNAWRLKMWNCRINCREPWRRRQRQHERPEQRSGYTWALC